MNAENRLVEVESAVNVPGQARMREEWTHLPDGRWIQRIISMSDECCKELVDEMDMD